MEIIHAVIVALVFGAAVYVMRAVLVSRKHKNSADTSVTTNPAYDYSADDFMCLMRTDGSTTINCKLLVEVPLQIAENAGGSSTINCKLPQVGLFFEM